MPFCDSSGGGGLPGPGAGGVCACRRNSAGVSPVHWRKARLKLDGSKSLFAARMHLLDFAERCRITDPRRRVGELLATTERGLAQHRALLELEPVVDAGVRGAFERFASGFKV